MFTAAKLVIGSAKAKICTFLYVYLTSTNEGVGLFVYNFSYLCTQIN